MSPRRVLLLHSSAGHYGADRQLALIATGLDPARYVPLVVLAEQGPLVDDLRAAGVETRIRRLAVVRRGELTPAGLARLGRRLASDANWLRPLARGAVVHSNTSVTLSGAAAARLVGAPHVWHVREIYSEFPRSWRLFRRALLSAAALPCVSGAVRAQFGDASQAFVLHDGIVPLASAPPLAVARGGSLVVATLGRISAWKGQALLLRAIAALPGAIALIAGDAWPGQEARELELRRLAEQLGIAERVHFLGFIEQPAAIYAAADVVVIPSINPDPLPNAALEAAAAGCCVVASDHGGLREIVRHGETGLLFAPGDVGALTRSLGSLDRERIATLGAAAAADVRERFAPALMLERLQALYDEL